MRSIRDIGQTGRLAAAGALLVAAVALAYLPLGGNGFVNFDDDRLILDNAALRELSPAGLQRIFELQRFTPHYKPLVYLSWAAELRWFGPDPRAFHRHNLLLHLGSTLLILSLAWRIALPRAETAMPGAAEASGTGDGWRLAAAAAVAAIWALHPMKVESVAWAAERKDVLFALFYLAALAGYLRYLEGRGRRWLAASAALGLAAMLSKSMAITLLPAMLLVDLARRRRWSARLALDKLPCLGVSLLALWLYGLLPLAGGDSSLTLLEGGGGAVARLAAAAHRHLAFAGHWLTPVDLAVFYPVPGFLVSPGPALLALWALAHLALVAAVAPLVRRRPRIAAAALFYTLTLLPALVAPISTTNYLSDRYTYLPSLGLAALVTLAATEAARRRPALRPLLAVAGVLLVVALGLLTHRQVGVWRDSRALWDHTLEARGPHAYAFNNRGVAVLELGDRSAALADFERALAARPDYPEALANRGDLLRRMGRAEEALADLERAVALQPAHARLYRARGLARVALGSLAAGIADYDRALELDPRDAEALYLRSQARRRAGDLAGANADLDRALATAPPTAEMHQLRSLIHAELGRFAAALADADRAVELDPADAVNHNNRGFLRLRLGDPANALVDLDRALALRPGYGLAHRNRGDALERLGRLDEACASWRAAQASDASNIGRRLDGCASAPAD